MTAAARDAVRAAADVVSYASARASNDRLLLNEAVEALQALRALRDDLGPIEAQLLECAKRDGLTWEEIAERVYGRRYRQWMIRRYEALGGKKKWPSGRRARR